MMPEGFWPDELSVNQVEVERLRRDKRNARNATIEECARVAEHHERMGFSYDMSITKAIRALKSTPGDEMEPSTSCAKPTSV